MLIIIEFELHAVLFKTLSETKNTFALIKKISNLPSFSRLVFKFQGRKIN